MSTYLGTFLLITVGFYLFLFMFWQAVSEDHDDRQIFKSGFGIGFCSLVAAVVVNVFASRLSQNSIFNPQFLYWWGALIGLLIGARFTSKSLKVSLVELIEYLTPGVLLWFGLASIPLSPFNVLLSVFALSLYYFARAHYRKLHWYRSGKVGFASFLTLGIYFSVRAAIAVIAPHMIFSVGKVEGVLATSLAFLCFWAIYQLSDA